MTHLPREIARALDGRPDAGALARTWQVLGSTLTDTLPHGAPTTAEAWAELEILLGRQDAPRVTHGVASPAADRPALRGPHAGSAVRRWRPAAAVAVLLAVALGGDAWWARQPVEATAAAGGRTTVALADGSRVVLNSGSRLTVAHGLGSALPWRATARRAVLEGEAFFAVAHDADRPFVVRTFNAEVAVLGTRFNVRAWRGERDAATRVALESGRVRVSARSNTAAGEAEAATAGAVVLAPGEAAVVAVGRAATSATVSVDRAVAWQAGGFAVEGLPLGDVLAEVGRRFGAEVRAAPGVPLALPVTLYYRDGVTADDVLHDLALAAGLRYRPLQGGFEVLPSGAP